MASFNHSEYQQVVIETYPGPDRGSKGSIRARPVAGQAYPTSMNVECSRKMRTHYPVGTKFKIYAKEIACSDGPSFLYTHFSWPYEVA
jgi:hypothetical protein